MKNIRIHRGKLLAAVVALALALWAQNQDGKITGTVLDPDGRTLAKAGIQAKNSGTGATFQVVSGARGEYTLNKLPAGTYELSVFAPGLMPYEQKGIAVRPDTAVKVPVRLSDVSLNTLGEDRAFFAALMLPHQAPSGAAPRTAEGKADLSGVWHGFRDVGGDSPQMLPQAEALFRERTANHAKDYPSAHCLPTPLLDLGTPVYRLVQNKEILVMLSEGDLPRQIFLDGRPHPKDLNPTWMGHSVGRWEGDTLVVDTVGFNGGSWLDFVGHPHTSRMHVVERYHRPDSGHLELEMTIEDPGAYAKPWRLKRVSDLAVNDEVMEYVCTENNRDAAHLVGQ